MNDQSTQTDDPKASTGASVSVKTEAQRLVISVAGSLSLVTLREVWRPIARAIEKQHPKEVVLDAAELRYCDGAGLGMLTQLRRELSGWGGSLKLTNLQPELQSLVDLAALKDPSASQLAPPPRHGLLATIGLQASLIGIEARETLAFLGHLTSALTWACFHPRSVRWRDVLVTADKVGTDALPVICLLGFLIGNILAFQAAPPVERLGGRDIIPTLVSISVVRELGPLIACILLAGRTGSAFAAELGTMTVTEEVSALVAMGFDPVQFLAVPRTLAVAAMAPLLSVFSNLTGVVGGYCIMASYGFSPQRYAIQIRDALTVRDAVGGIVKTIVFGLIVGGVGCLRGLRTASGPGAVGDSATRAVVTSIVLIIIADGMFSVAFYYLGL